MRVLIVAGGTAGHVNPALTIASAILDKYPDVEVHFAGKRQGMEYKLVEKFGYPFHHISVYGINRSMTPKNICHNVKSLWFLAFSGYYSKKLLNELKPDLVVGAGGYVSGPVVRQAAKMGIKTALHEQNAFPGVTNKLLAKDVDLVMVAVESAIEKLKANDKSVVVGNPVRKEIFNVDKKECRKILSINEDEVVILSFGGSLGAKTINEVSASLAQWHTNLRKNNDNRKFYHIHATGRYGVELFSNLSKEKCFAHNTRMRVSEYISDMSTCLGAADLVISRAGALTIAELSACGRASILIPSPNVSENHQYYNALELEKVGAAVVIEEKNLTGEKLIEVVDKLTSEKDKLTLMGMQAKAISEPECSKKILNSLEKIVDFNTKS